MQYQAIPSCCLGEQWSLHALALKNPRLAPLEFRARIYPSFCLFVWRDLGHIKISLLSVQILGVSRLHYEMT